MNSEDNLPMEKRQIGRLIRDARERKRLSQEQLAQQMDSTQRAVSEIENGKRKLSVEEVQTLSRLLDIPLLDFFDDHELPRNDLDISLLQVFHALPNDIVRRDVIHLIQSIVNLTKSP